ncbi:hypothetical protein sscle_02g016550 [Sclerotinia sclerotiorum 1980 UF-70]|uniref:Uncharacterized protein n=1 Tax=Sclerotinia sclerotiorum (strain ATCC 18683 / 1980 / Ss-1) TaxID=665079 RepID=A0A1D9PVY6_SCLS1|nr:hypothetical protein sscle_02g016550 [Sclerotinia sclerotiorum 1980 UF-70]
MPDKPEDKSQIATPVEDDDEPDEWDKRIFSTGCAGTLRLSGTTNNRDANAKSLQRRMQR